MMSGGYSPARIKEAYQELSEEDIREAVEYAACVVDDEKVIARGRRQNRRETASRLKRSTRYQRVA